MKKFFTAALFGALVLACTIRVSAVCPVPVPTAGAPGGLPTIWPGGDECLWLFATSAASNATAGNATTTNTTVTGGKPGGANLTLGCGDCYRTLVSAVTRLPGLQGATLTNKIIQDCGNLILAQQAVRGAVDPALVNGSFIPLCQAQTMPAPVCPPFNASDLAPYSDVLYYCGPEGVTDPDPDSGTACGRCMPAVQRAVLSIPGVQPISQPQLLACSRALMTAIFGNSSAPAKVACFEKAFSLLTPGLEPAPTAYPSCPLLITSVVDNPFPDLTPDVDDLVGACTVENACTTCLRMLWAAVADTPGLRGVPLTKGLVFECGAVLLQQYAVPLGGLSLDVANALLKCRQSSLLVANTTCPTRGVFPGFTDMVDHACAEGVADYAGTDPCSLCTPRFNKIFLTSTPGLDLTNAAQAADCLNVVRSDYIRMQATVHWAKTMAVCLKDSIVFLPWAQRRGRRRPRI